MNDDLGTSEQTAREGGMSRRSLVKTGANLAWAVPAVTVVTAAPALAVSETQDPVDPPADQNPEGTIKNNGKKATFFVDGGTANRALVPGDIAVVLKSKNKVGGNGGSGWDRNPDGAAKRSEYTYILSVPVAQGEELPDLKVNMKARRFNGRKRLAKRSRYFVTDTSSGEVIWTGVLKTT